MDKFTKLLDELSEIGYEADNMDCMELEYSDGNGFVTFITKDCVQVRLPFTDWELNRKHYLELWKFIALRTNIKQMTHAVVVNVSSSFRAENKNCLSRSSLGHMKLLNNMLLRTVMQNR